MNMREKILETYPEHDELVFLHGFDDAILGTALSQGNTVVCYSMKAMVDTLMKNENLSEIEAYEWLDHNTFFAYFGEHSPVYFEDTK